MPEDRTALTVWGERAAEALEQALEELHAGDDPLASVSLANACLEAEQGLLDADEVANLEFTYDEPVCTCPADLVARGGWRSGCSAHG